MSGRITLCGLLSAALSLGFTSIAAGQTPAQDPAQGLQVQLQELRLMLNDLRDQLASSRRESQDLRRDLDVVREQLDSVRSDSAKAHGVGAEADRAATEDRLAKLAEDQQLIAAKVDDQYQTKVASGSKYRVRLSGLVLFNVFSNHGSMDNMDLPGIAIPKASGDSNGSFGATVRQSQVSLEILGPELGGAKTSGNLNFDFFGGFPSTTEGVTAGLVRLRTAKLALDWKNTSVVAGQDTPFFSPLSPTSLVSTAYPAMAYSGNLWTWTPQVYVEQRVALSDDSKVALQFGILDPLTGELPAAEYNRMPTAGERSGMPAYAMRLGWQRAANEQVAALGIGAYYARQNWGFNRTVDAWAATADWSLPLGPWFSLSGELYRGRGIAGLGAGATGSVLFIGLPDAPNTYALVLNSAGGWSQLKFKPVPKTEFNAAFGEDRPFPYRFSQLQLVHGSPITRNASGFLNVIYQARSNLLFSVEYRRLWTSRFGDSTKKAGQVGLGAGIIF